MARRPEASEQHEGPPVDPRTENEHVGDGPGELPPPSFDPNFNLDSERKPIRRIILHHTVTAPNTTWRTVSEIHREKIYGPNHPHSGHRDPATGEETFVAYHFLVYQPGQNPEGPALIRRCLQDQHIGWHAGDWPVNCESVAFSFVGDYRGLEPLEAQLNAIADIAVEYDRAAGGHLLVQLHREISSTACPANVEHARDALIAKITERLLGGQQPDTPPEPVPAQADFVEEAGRALVSAPDGLRVRRAPSTSADVVTTVPNGTVMDYIGFTTAGEPVNGNRKWWRNRFGNCFSEEFAKKIE